MRKIDKRRRGQSSFGRRPVNDPEQSEHSRHRLCSVIKSALAKGKLTIVGQAPRLPDGDVNCKARALAGGAPALQQQLSWRAFVVRQNFSNCRRKVLDTGTGHDDAVATAMSFFGDAQEFPTLVFPELHVEMLALYLQFSRLDNVIHFL